MATLEKQRQAKTAEGEDRPDRMQQMRTMLDEIKLKLHLGSREVRDEWQRLERAVRDGGHRVGEWAGATEGKVDELFERLQKLRRQIKDDQSKAAKCARDVMTSGVEVVSETGSLAEAARCMWEKDIGLVPVVDGGGRLVGVITDRDACMSAYMRGRPLADIPVHEAMAHTVQTCGPDDPIEAVEATMSAHQIRRIPVVDEGNVPIGMITVNDIARVASGKGGKPSQLDQDVVETLACITSPRPQTPGARAN